jgi:hypothetical protein
MSWSFKTKMTTGYTFAGELPYPSTAIEVPITFKDIVERVTFEYKNQYEHKYTGFETIKHKVNYYNEKAFSIMLVGNLTRGWQDLLVRLATAMNGSGCILQFYDDWITGTTSVPVTYECRWVNAGDFVDNNELLCGGSMELICFDSAAQTTITEYQKMILTPGSGLEWQYNKTTVGVEYEYYRVV